MSNTSPIVSNYFKIRHHNQIAVRQVADGRNNPNSNNNLVELRNRNYQAVVDSFKEAEQVYDNEFKAYKDRFEFSQKAKDKIKEQISAIKKNEDENILSYYEKIDNVFKNYFKERRSYDDQLHKKIEQYHTQQEEDSHYTKLLAKATGCKKEYSQHLDLINSKFVAANELLIKSLDINDDIMSYWKKLYEKFFNNRELVKKNINTDLQNPNSTTQNIQVNELISKVNNEKPIKSSLYKEIEKEELQINEPKAVNLEETRETHLETIENSMNRRSQEFVSIAQDVQRLGKKYNIEVEVKPFPSSSNIYLSHSGTYEERINRINQKFKEEEQYIKMLKNTLEEITKRSINQMSHVSNFYSLMQQAEQKQNEDNHKIGK